MDQYYELKDLDDSEFKERFNARREDVESRSAYHVNHMITCKHGGIDIDGKCFLPTWDERFELPSIELVGQVVDLLIDRGMSKSEISNAIGISTTGSNRLLNYWINPESDRNINKSNWVALATLAGLMLPTMYRK